VAIAALYEVLLRADLTRLDVGRAVAAWPDAAGALERVLRLHPDDGPVKEIVPQAMAKYVPARDLAVRLESLAAQWGDLSAGLGRQLMPAAQLQALLEAVGAPSHPRQIGLDWKRFRRTYARAQTIRSRYTVLDVVLEAGLLDGMVEELFAAEGFWGAQAG
jgi:glycerol-1-phosphate dehydrogenase [NAD(P)+]